MSLYATLRRAILSAVPTCSLWEHDIYRRIYWFRPLPWIVVTEWEVRLESPNASFQNERDPWAWPDHWQRPDEIIGNYAIFREFDLAQVADPPTLTMDDLDRVMEKLLDYCDPGPLVLTPAEANMLGFKEPYPPGLLVRGHFKMPIRSGGIIKTENLT